MRKQLLGVFLPLLAMVLRDAAETQSAGVNTNTHASLQKVNVVHGEDGITLEVIASGQVKPRVETLASPARLVIDLPNTAMATSVNHIDVAGDGVKDVRIGTDDQAMPTTRVVVDLLHQCRYEIIPGPSGKFIVKLHTPSAVAAVTPIKVPAPVPSAKAPVAVVVPVPQIQTEKLPSTILADEKAPAATAPSTASSFVVVEPSYKPKQATDDSASAVTGPPVRAIQAAAKFVERPDTNLLPAPSASMQSTTSSTAAATPKVPTNNLAAEQKAQSMQQPVVSGPKYTGEPISVNLKDVDLKDFFRLIHEISGLNVVLDPNVHGTLTIVLDDVPWDQALDIVLKNNDLARQLDGNVLRIATVETLKREADARRAQIESEALAVEKVSVTRFLSYAKAKDVIVTVKKFLSQRGDVVADDRTNAVIINDIPKTLPTIDRLLTQLDRKTQEVEIEARVVAATRQFARDIGTQLGFGWGNGHTAIGGNQAVGSSPTTVTLPGQGPGYITVPGTGGSTTGSSIPLFSNLGATAPTSGLSFVNASSTVRIDAILSLAESRGLLKVLSRPRVVTQNNIQAFVKQGVRVPIVTQAQLGGPPTVTYVDAFLRLTVTPQITSENTIFLNVDVENTTPNFGQEVQGNPELITQQATTQVLVTDGGTVVIGGVIQTQNSINITQVPLLGNIPVLGNLFKHTQVNTSNQELIFFITPRIIQT